MNESLDLMWAGLFMKCMNSDRECLVFQESTTYPECTCASTSWTAKVRKYDNYLLFDFTNTVVNNEEHPQCIIFLQVLDSDSMKPHKLKKLLETKHKDVSAKHWDFFVSKFNSFRSAHKVSQNGKFTTKRYFSFISSLIQDSSKQKSSHNR